MMSEEIKTGTIARIEVTRGTLTEYPIAEKVHGGWQNGVTFYPDVEVTKVSGRYARMDDTGADEARRILTLASVHPSAEWASQTGESKSDMLAEAQVHATLALVEKQRIANLISVYTATGDVESGFVGAGIDFGHIAAQIKEGLGL